jgi:hypothetical protein
VSAATDALRDAIEALDIDGVETEVDELRSALDTARTALKDAAKEVREALRKVPAVAATVRQLCEPDENGLIHEERIVEALDTVGGADSALYGPIEDLDTAADSLDSAADDVTSALGDEQQQDVQPAGSAQAAASPARRQ